MKIDNQVSLFGDFEETSDTGSSTITSNTSTIRKTDATSRRRSRSEASERAVKGRAKTARVHARLTAAGERVPASTATAKPDATAAEARAKALADIEQLTAVKDAADLTAQHGWTYYLTRPKDSDAAVTNASRSPSDLSGRRRALRDAAFGHAHTDDLSRVPLSFLARDLDELLADLERGLRRRLGLDATQPLSTNDKKRLSNESSDLKNVRVALGDVLTLPGVAPKAARHLRKIKTGRWQQGFKRAQWSARLKAEVERMRAAYTDGNYAGPGHRYFRSHSLRPRSFDNDQTRLNRVVDFMVNEEGIAEPTLHDFIDLERLLRFRAWYFTRVSEGGYAQFRQTCSALAKIAKYLTSIGELDTPYDATSKHPDAPWSQLTLEGKHTLRDAESKQLLAKAEEVDLRTPFELKELAEWCRRTLPRTTDDRRPSNRQWFRRRFAAVFFGLGIHMPLRSRNWREMQWGRNLYQQDGAWHVRFVGDELKNGSYSRGIRKYELRLPEKAGGWIEWWREQLRIFVGDDFETVTPLVFPMLSTLTDEQGEYRWVEMSEKYILSCVDDASLEGTGKRFKPHAIRHCVATFIVMSGLMRDVQQAATLLGDTIETVMRKYFKPDEQKLLDEGYYARLAARDSSR
ncbi:hypothetical protein [Deinococcus yavapaiensis]|uniref:Phage integrase family protein n=1 Tax=Deinococcus yavapaiensis KR-236 TaxID=694435 RepID=A0A318SBG7_9DEIO|nr:hypothetical protein [Deinococcus yavapaiensis]PYE54077.1 hypothetical protein DES52_10639 [Deinococcus yavapaiensis KR-236]